MTTSHIWLKKVCKINRNMIVFNIFLHENHRNRLDEVKEYWSRITGYPVNDFSKVYWKKHIPKTKRKHVGEDYFGVLKFRVKKSSELVRRITGWFSEIAKNSIGGSSNGRTGHFERSNEGPIPSPPAKSMLL